VINPAFLICLVQLVPEKYSTITDSLAPLIYPVQLVPEKDAAT
jgi:hypothetical protein